MEEKDIKKEVTLFSILIAVVVLILIIALVMIWAPKKEKPQELKFGQYTSATDSNNKYLNSYLKEIADLLKRANIKEIYSKLTNTYITEKGITEDNLKALLEGKKILGVDLVPSNYINGIINNERYYRVRMTSKDQLLEEYIIIRELSPRNYTIAFDDYIYKATLNKKFISNKISVELVDVNFGVTTYKMKLKIRNNNDQPVTLNSDSKNECIYGYHLNDGEIVSSSSFAMGRPVVIQPNQEINTLATFKVGQLSHGYMAGFSIKSVKVPNNDEPIEIKFLFNEVV
ncbi:MAG: hypothetical protein RR988_05690 [Clostridia bacterium]